MQILLITTIPQRKMIKYIVSALHILKRLQTRDTALRIIKCQDSTTVSQNQNIIILTPDQNNIKGTKIQMYTSLPHHSQKIYSDGMDKAVVE